MEEKTQVNHFWHIKNIKLLLWQLHISSSLLLFLLLFVLEDITKDVIKSPFLPKRRKICLLMARRCPEGTHILYTFTT